MAEPKTIMDAVKYELKLANNAFGDEPITDAEAEQLVEAVVQKLDIFGSRGHVIAFFQAQASMSQMLGLQHEIASDPEEIENVVGMILDRYEAYRNGEVEVEQHPAVATEETGQDDGNVLDTANSTVGQRADEYGPPTENFRAIAEMWSAYLDIEITPYDYSQMMQLAKIGRTKTGSPDRDTHVDQAGYALCTDLVWNDGSEPAPYQNR